LSDARSVTVAVGVVSMGIGVLNTVSAFFNWAKLPESHRMVALQYAKVNRSIMLELALPRAERIRAHDFLKMVRDNLDRLHETSPAVPDSVINEFKVKFEHTTPDVSKPEITNGLDPIDIYVDEDTRKAIMRTKSMVPSPSASLPPPTPIQVHKS
jgi:hypothetical protein